MIFKANLLLFSFHGWFSTLFENIFIKNLQSWFFFNLNPELQWFVLVIQKKAGITPAIKILSQ
jgi:hypothetical protein